MPILPIVFVVVALTLVVLIFGFDRDLVVFALIGLGIASFFVYLAQRRLARQVQALQRQLAGMAQVGPDRPVEGFAATGDSPGGGTVAEPSGPDITADRAAAEAFADSPPASPIDAEDEPSPEVSRSPGAAANLVDRLVDRLEDLVRAGARGVTAYFADGNLFVRIGLLVLFVGVAFLLKYAAEQSIVPVELRFLAAAIGGMTLLGFGWRLRRRKTVYALLLQGGGIGVTYLTIFAAFRVADLLPPMLTFALLIAFAALTVALALLQNSLSLAIFAVLGGFLAPLLASSGSGNYIGLFSYYAVLNAAVFALAWTRAWRALNLIGFAFTFGVFTLWTLLSYRAAYLYPALAFLALYLLMYSLIGILYAIRQPRQMTGLVDGTLVFGTPVIASSLAMAMLHDQQYGIAIASAGLGVYYLGLATFAWRRIGEDMRLMAEALLAIGVVFATLAIPYALDGQWSSAAWALEAAGILWVSIRQQRLYAQCFAMVLQLAAGLLFFETLEISSTATAWLNQAFIGGFFIALGGLVSARLLYLQPVANKLRLAHLLFFPWGLGWWIFSVLLQIDEFHYPATPSLLTLFTATAAALLYCDRLRGWDWRPASIGAALLLPVLIPIALVALFEQGHLLRSPDWYFWIVALGACYWIICRLESVAWPGWVNVSAHTLYVVFVSLLISIEALWFFDRQLQAAGEGYHALIALAPLAAFSQTLGGRWPPIGRIGEPLRISLAISLAVLLILWSLAANLGNSGNPAPLPYLPLLNPLDLANIALLLLLLAGSGKLPAGLVDQRRNIQVIVAGLAFLWLTMLLIRSMHHFLDIPFALELLAGDSRVQTAISILWTIVGIAAMWLASTRALRRPWIAAAVLVGIVLLKMLFVDLGASGTIERIVSFLVVGSLLVATGYFSPIPARRRGDDPDSDKTIHA